MNAQKMRNTAKTVFPLLMKTAIFVYAYSYSISNLIWKTPRLEEIVRAGRYLADRLISLLLCVMVFREIWVLVRMCIKEMADKTENAPPKQAKAFWNHVLYLGVSFAVLAFMYAEAGWVTVPLIILLSKELTFRERMETCFFAFAAYALTWAAVCAAGWLDLSRYYEFSYGTFRSFGLQHPNLGGEAVLFLLLTYWYAYGRAHTGSSSVLCLISAGISWFLFGCRTAALLSVLFLFLILIRDARDSRSLTPPSGQKTNGVLRVYEKAGRVIGALSPLLLTGLTALLGAVGILVGESRARYFSRRFVEFLYAFEKCGLALGPRDLNAISGYHFYLDNTYVWMIFGEGLLFAAGCMIWMGMAGYQAFSRRRSGVLLIVFIIFVYALMERTGHILFMMAVSAMNLFVTENEEQIPRSSLRNQDREDSQ